ncbi:MAG TPA: hypothetical protein VK470_19600 [Bacteroidota bacterium]|nr:hypothetical protein [Bacteroidota bacterium]
MKRFSLYCALVLFVSIFSSCSNSSNPTAQLSQDEPSMRTRVSNVSLITLPASKDPNVLRKSATTQVWVTQADGGDVTISNTYTASDNSTVSIDMNLHFEPGTVTKDQMISIMLDSQTLMADFSPSQVFAKPAKLTATISGLDLKNIPGDINLYFIDGMSFEEMGAPVVDKKAGTITLTGADIPHFSLYGFGYTK